MPMYSYACTACGHRFDVKQTFTDEALTDCPQCAGRLRKVFSAVGVVFKGSGFYRTDSRSPAASNGGPGPKEGTGEGKAATEKSSDSSGAAKTSVGGSGDGTTSNSGTSGGSGSSANTPAPAGAPAG